MHVLRRDPGRVRFAVNLAGFVGSGEQPTDGALATARPPVFWGLRRRGRAVHAASIRDRTATWLEAHTALEARVYPGLGHSISRDELDDVGPRS